MSCSSLWRARMRSSISRSKKREWPGPSSLARPSARSAFFSSSSGSVPSTGPMATPTLTVIETECSSISNEVPSTLRTRLTRASAAATGSSANCRTTNSSPPMRAIISAPSRRRRSRWAMLCNSASPIEGPTESLTSLNRSISSSSTTRKRPSCGSVESTCCMRSRSCTRFGRSVSASWRDMCDSFASMRRRCVTSSCVATHPPPSRGSCAMAMTRPSLSS